MSNAVSTTEAPALPTLYQGSELIELDASDAAHRRIYVMQGNTRLRNILDGVKLGDVFIATDAEDPMAEKIGGVDDPFTIYVMAVSKGVVHIDKENNGRLTFLTGQPDAEDRLSVRERDIWRSYHYIVKVEGVDEPVSWMLTGFSGSKTAEKVNTLIIKRMKSGLGGVTPMILKASLKSNGSNTWAVLTALPTPGDDDELAAAIDLAEAGLDRMRYRQSENDAPTVVDEDTF